VKDAYAVAEGSGVASEQYPLVVGDGGLGLPPTLLVLADQVIE
jgi:hypothetical protein